MMWGQVRYPQDSIAYDPRGGLYLRYVRAEERAPMRLRQAFTPKEYVEWRQAELRRRYALGHKGDSIPLPSFLAKDTTPRLKPKLKFDLIGDIVLSVGNKVISDDNPAVPESLRKRSYVDFKQSVNVRATATYGDHLKMDVGYNTESSLWGESRRLNLSYKGERHDAIKGLEVGDISFVSANPLIQGLSPLFGIKGEMALGALNIKTFVSKREGASRRMTVRGGRQVRPFEIRGSEYDRARHFFLSEFFAHRYDEALSLLPLVSSDLYIERIQVWVTARANERSAQVIEQVGALASLSTAARPSDNQDDKHYTTLSTQPLSAWKAAASGTSDIEVMEGARRLPEGAYKVNRQLGYLSLNIPLSDDEALAVSYEYTYQGRRYRVGDFAGDDTPSDLIPAALIATRAKEPTSPVWDLMMKNAYALPGGGRGLTREDLKVDVLYKDFSANTERRNITQGSFAGRSWSELFGWDKSDDQGSGTADGRFDFVPDVTVDTAFGVLFLPSRRPLETVIRRANGGASYYPTYEQLYDTTQIVTRRLTDIDLFSFKGEYSSDARTTIFLGGSDIVPGSVTLTTRGRQLQEGADFSINYASGELTLLPSAAISESEEIEVVIEERDRSSRRDKTLMGIEATYALSPYLSVGATALDYRERGIRRRIRWGEEPIHNRMWGLHLDYGMTSTRWTEWLNTLPMLELDEPSSLNIRTAFAKLDMAKKEDQDIVVEDFEQSTTTYDLLDPWAWRLSSPPSGTDTPLDGDHRALLAWYSIDPRLVREDLGNIMPDHLRRNKAQRQGLFVREVPYIELFPSSDHTRLSSSFLNTVNLSFYPKERGPYNLSTTGIDTDAYFSDPMRMWGGVMRSLPVRDFEAARVEYIEGWFMDPFAEATTPPKGGELIIDLGRLSEDILADDAHAYENGLPSTLHPERKTYDIPLGQAPAQQVQVYAFDRMGDEDNPQDIGYNGLSSSMEKTHGAYTDFLDKMAGYRDAKRWKIDGTEAPFHPLNDPAGDDYQFYLGDFWDRMEADILTRYKFVNGVEGNSSTRTIRGQQSARSWMPDTEDLDGDMQMDKTEAFFRYRMKIDKGSFEVGRNHIVSQQKTEVDTPDGTKEVTWYKVRIPLSQYSERIGSQPSLRDVRGIRLFVKGFEETVHLRWAALRLVRSDWSLFDTPLTTDDRRTGDVALGVLSLEEDSGRTPVPYVLPPGLDRERAQEVFDSALQDERSLSLRLDRLEGRQPVGIYKSFRHDLRHYDKLKMYVHAESPVDDPKLLTDGALEVFVRLGRDYTENYYEYRLPLKVTAFAPDGTLPLNEYDIWPVDNNVEIPLQELARLKNKRDAALGHDPSHPFEEVLSSPSRTTISVKGHPSLGDVTAVMIGVRSTVDHTLRGEVWFDELRVSGTGHGGGHALTAQADLRLSDLARIEVSGTTRSAGFGLIDNNIRHLRMDDSRHFDLKGELRLGKFFPPSWKADIPIKYQRSFRRSSPKFDPIADDILYSERLTALSDNERQAYDLKVSHIEQTGLLSIEDVHFDIKDSIPKFWHPANLRLAYRQEESRLSSPELAGHYRRHATSHLIYAFTAQPKGIEIDKDLTLYPYPQEWQVVSRWRRTYDHRKQWDKTIFDNDDKVSHHLYHRFDWERSLRIGWQVADILRLSWDSTTNALIDEPFERELSRHGDVAFRALSDTIAHSLLHLGRTASYDSRGHLSLRLPKFEHRLLEGLSGSLTLTGNYRWDREALSHRQLSTGHNVRRTTMRDILLSYRLERWLRHLSLRQRDSWGSHIPGFLPEAGAFFGLSKGGDLTAPGLGYMLGLGDEEKHLRRTIDKAWVITDRSRQRPLSWYHNADFEAELSFAPFKGLRLDLYLSHIHHSRAEFLPAEAHNRPRRMGSLSFSTIGLGHFFDRPLREEGYRSALFEDYRHSILARRSALKSDYIGMDNPHTSSLAEKITAIHPDVLGQAFMMTYAKRMGQEDKLLPGLTAILPNWGIHLDLAELFPRLKKLFPKLELQHRYRGRMEVNSYRLRDHWQGFSSDEWIGFVEEAGGNLRPGALYEPLTMTQRDELSPFVGIEVGIKHGPSFDVRYNKVRELTLLLQSARLLEQYRDEVLAGLRYRTKVPSVLRLFTKKKVEDSALTAQCSMTLGQNYIVSRDLSRYTAQATQGIRSLTTRLALDYTITTGLSLRGFYDIDRRTPLVSLHTYPFISKSYGLMLRLSLRP